MRNSINVLLPYRIIFLLLVFFSSSIIAQSDFVSEADLKKQASKHFEKEEYVAATPLYSQLVSLYPKDPTYNYRFGVCMYYSGGDREKPLPFLEFASQKKEVDKEVFYYLGKLYQLNYRFDNAIAAYTTFKKVGSGSQVKKLEVDRQIAMCNNGKSLLKSISDLVVLDKKELKEEEYFRSYDLTDIGGKLLVKPDDFRSSLDKKKKEKSIIYLSKKNDQIYYSSYGTDASKGRDLFVINKKPDGSWSEAQALPNNINTPFDDDYPFLHPNGKSLYFCSKGHNSMGGYDIFKSTFNDETKTWSDPVNLDFAINSPDDDILYVTDSLEKTAYFSSNRFSEDGKIAVFKIKVDRRPVDAAIIGGTFVKASSDKRMDAKITVKNIDKNELVGIFNTNSATGEYSLQLPNGGNFLFTVESDGYNSQTETVVVPLQKEWKPLRQSISYESGTGKLVITNYFDDPISESSYLAALSLIREKAKLEVTSGNPELLLASTTTTLEVKGEDLQIKPTGKKLTNDDLIKIAQEDADEVEKEAKDIRAEADAAKNIANARSQEAQAKSKESDLMLQSANTAKDEKEKQVQLNKANVLKGESESLSKETVIAFNLAKKLDDDAIAKQEEADLSNKYVKDLESAVKSNNSADALSQLEIQKNKLEEIGKQPKGADNAYQAVKHDIENKEKQSSQLSENTRSLFQEIPQLEEEAKRLRADAEKTKKPDLKQGMLDQAAEIDADIIKKKKEAEQNDAKVKELDTETTSLKNEAELVNKLVNQIKNETGGTYNPTVAAVKPVETKDEPTSAQQTNPAAVSETPKPLKTVEQPKPEVSATVAPKAGSNSSQNKADSINAANQVGFVNGKQVEVKTVETALDYNDKYKQELEKAEALPNAKEREAAINKVYKDWQETIKKDIAKKQTQLAAAKFAPQKQAFTNKINKLNAQLKENEQAKVVSVTNAKQGPKAITVSNNVKTGQPAKQNSSKGETPVSNQALASKKFSAQLSDTLKSKSPYEIELKKSEINKEWSFVLDKEIAEKQQRLKTLTDSAEKNGLETEIASLKKQSDEKKSVAEQSKIKADQLRQHDILVKSNDLDGKIESASGVSEVISNYKNVYSTQLQSADKKDNSFDREFSKAVINKKWINTITLEKENKQAILVTSKKKEKKVLQSEIKELDKQLAERQTLQQEIAAKLNDAKQKELGAIQASEVKTPESEGSANLYTSSTSVSGNNEVNALIKESVELKNQAKLERESVAALPDSDEKKGKLAKADELEISATKKENEASNITDKINKVEFYNNDSNLEQLVKLSANNKEDEIAVAELSKDEAKTLFEDAKKISEKAASTEDAFAKKSLLENAINKENLALEKQRKAKEIYKKYHPEYQFKDNSAIALASTSNSVDGKKSDSVPTLSNNPPQTSSTVEDVKNKKEYKDFTALKAEAEAALKDAQNKYKTAEELRASGEEDLKQSQDLLAKVDELKTDEAKQESYQKAIFLANQAKEKLAKSNAMKESARTIEANATVKKERADSIFKTFDPKTVEQIAMLEGGQPKTVSTNVVPPKTVETTLATSNKETSNKDLKNQKIDKNNSGSLSKIILAEGETYSILSNSIYSDANPIPIDPKLPEGLIFKVQVGAFRNAIPQDMFKGINPIMGETTPKGFIRYTAGIFVKYETADAVKEEIKGYGFKDAFVVAFYNGKRISINDAYARIGRNDLITKPAAASTPVVETPPAKVEPVASANASQPKNENNPIVANDSEISSVSASDLQNTTGLIYTVQVGVYSKKSKATKLKSIPQLYKEVLPGDNTRFTSGKYTDISLANISRNSIVLNNNIKDAFVTAYYNGKRISLAEAKQLQNKGTVSSVSNEKQTKEVVVNNGSKKAVANTELNNDKASKSFPNDSGVVYRIQIGAFRGEVPLDVANLYIKIAKKGIKQYRDENQLYVYTVGAFPKYDDALVLKQEILDNGIKDAFVVAFYYGQKVTISEAQNIQNK